MNKALLNFIELTTSSNSITSEHWQFQSKILGRITFNLVQLNRIPSEVIFLVLHMATKQTLYYPINNTLTFSPFSNVGFAK